MSGGVDKPLSFGMQKLSRGILYFRVGDIISPPVKLFRTILSPGRVKVIPRILLGRILHFATPATRNISETVEDRAKATINGLRKVVDGLSVAAKMYDLE